MVGINMDYGVHAQLKDIKMITSWIGNYAFIVFALVSFWPFVVIADELPSLSNSNISLSTPTDEQRDRVVHHIAELELETLEHDSFMVEATGTRSFLWDKGKRVNVVEFSFIFAEEIDSKCKRYVCSNSKVIDEVSGTFDNKPGSPGLLSSQTDQRDVCVVVENGKKKTFYSVGGRDYNVRPEDSTSRLLTMAVIFNPLSACLNSIDELTESDVDKTIFGHFPAKTMAKYGRYQGLEVAEWYFRQKNTKLTKTPKDLVLSRRIAFREGRPVVVEDRFGRESQIEKAALSSRTEITWKKFGNFTCPRRIVASTGTKNDLQKTLDAKLQWSFGGQIPSEVFDPASVGKMGMSTWNASDSN